MDDQIEQLKHYTHYKIDRVSREHAWLKPVKNLFDDITVSSTYTDVLSDDQAQELTKTSQAHAVDPGGASEVFTDKESQVLLAIACRILELAVEDIGRSKTLEQLSHDIYPLYSQDASLEPIGFDLQEYMDWYFTDPDIDKRRQYADELMRDWGLNK